MANVQTTASVLRVRLPTTVQDTPLWRAKRRSEPRLITMPATPVSTPPTPDRGALTSTPSQGRKRTSARSGRPRYNPTGRDYNPVGPEPMIAPTGERNITKSWRRDNSPITINNLPQAQGQPHDEPNTPVCSTVVLVNQEQLPELQIGPENNNKQLLRRPQKRGRRRGGRRNQSCKRIPASELIILSTDEESSSSSESSITHSDALVSRSTTNISLKVKEAGNQQRPDANPERKRKTAKKPLEPISWWIKREGRLVNIRSNPQGPYYCGPSWGQPPHPSTLPIPSFFTAPGGKLNNPPHTLTQPLTLGSNQEIKFAKPNPESGVNYEYTKSELNEEAHSTELEEVAMSDREAEELLYDESSRSSSSSSGSSKEQ